MLHLKSLCHFLENELANYLQLLATLENEMHKDAAVMPKPRRDDEREGTSPAVSSLVVQQVPTESSGMTFQKLAIWADEYILKVRLMSSVVAEAKSGSLRLSSRGCHRLIPRIAESRGGALVSAIYVFTSHGDPFTRDFSNRILEEVSGAVRSLKDVFHLVILTPGCFAQL